MSSRAHRPSATGGQASDPEYEGLITRIRRLAGHRGYDRDELVSPMLKRLMPMKRPSGDPVAEVADLRKRVAEAGLDRNAVAYLTESVETELDFARLRLT